MGHNLSLWQDRMTDYYSSEAGLIDGDEFFITASNLYEDQHQGQYSTEYIQ